MNTEMKFTVVLLFVGTVLVWYYRQKTNELLPTRFGMKRRVVKLNQRLFGERLRGAALKGASILEHFKGIVG